MFDLRCAYGHGERTEGAVCRRVTVTTDYYQTGARQTKLWTDDVDDPLAVRLDSVEADAEVVGVLFESLYLLPRYLVLDEQSVDGRHVVVDCRDRQFRAAYGAAGHAQALKRLRRCHLVHEVKVDINQGRLSGRFAHDMRVPDLLKHRSRRHVNPQNL